MPSARVNFDPIGKILITTKQGKPLNLDPKSRVIINSSGVRICAENGNIIEEFSWIKGVRFQEKPVNVSEFLIKDGVFLVKNCLQKLANRSGGKVFGGNNSGYSLDEIINGRPIKVQVHYDEWIPVQLNLGFLNTTFVFDRKGLQIHLGNVLFKTHRELCNPSHAETWNQKVEYSGWGYRKPDEVYDANGRDTFVLGRNSLMVPIVLLSPQPPHPYSLSADGLEVIPPGSSWDIQREHLNIKLGNCFAAWFQNRVEQEYTQSCIELAKLESTPDNGESDRQALLQDVLFNIMEYGRSDVNPYSE